MPNEVIEMNGNLISSEGHLKLNFILHTKDRYYLRGDMTVIIPGFFFLLFNSVFFIKKKIYILLKSKCFQIDEKKSSILLVSFQNPILLSREFICVSADVSFQSQ